MFSMIGVYLVNMKTGIDGKRVRQLREDLGWTQEDLARAVSKLVGAINQSSISHVERGTYGMRVDALAALAVALDTSTDYLLGLTDDPDPRTSLEDHVILIEHDPVRRKFLQEFFNGIESLPGNLRDDYWSSLSMLYDGLIARQHAERRSSAIQKRNNLNDT
jgi:transcriptional regulator with XRE-family HTH domain